MYLFHFFNVWELTFSVLIVMNIIIFIGFLSILVVDINEHYNIGWICCGCYERIIY